MSFSYILDQFEGVAKSIENTIFKDDELETLKAVTKIVCIAAGIFGSAAILFAGATTSAIILVGAAILCHHELPIIFQNTIRPPLPFFAERTWTENMYFYLQNKARVLNNKFL